MRQLTRRELYNLVWSKPMTELAKEFGLSDVALHKTCKRHRIPTPGLGYWAKVAAGKPVKSIPFHDVSDGVLNVIRIFPSNLRSLPPEVKAAQEKAKAIKWQQNEKMDLASPEIVLEPHVERLKRKLETVSMQKLEHIHIQEPKFFSVSIAPASSTRLVAILNTLVRNALAQGFRIEPGEKALQFIVEGEAISLEISERHDKVPHIPTQEEVLELQKWEKRFEQQKKLSQWVSDWDRPKSPPFDYPLNGQLVLVIEKRDYGSDGIRRKFADGKQQHLEDMIPDILVSAATCAAAIKAARSDRERRAKERREEERLAEIKRRKDKVEEKRTKQLEQLITGWRRAAEIRDFAAAIETALQTAKFENPDGKTEIEKWINWARFHADNVDPLRTGIPLLFQEKDLGRWD